MTAAFLNTGDRMDLSIFDIYTIGIGPSSSHVVGPMRAGRLFAQRLDGPGTACLDTTASVWSCIGSLARTGAGHGTDRAVILGLCGETPEEIDPDAIDSMLDGIRILGKAHTPRHTHRFHSWRTMRSCSGQQRNTLLPHERDAFHCQWDVTTNL